MGKKRRFNGNDGPVDDGYEMEKKEDRVQRRSDGRRVDTVHRLHMLLQKRNRDPSREMVSGGDPGGKPVRSDTVEMGAVR